MHESSTKPQGAFAAGLATIAVLVALEARADDLHLRADALAAEPGHRQLEVMPSVKYARVLDPSARTGCAISPRSICARARSWVST